MREWPLILFTVAIQCSCGFALAATLFDARSANPALLRPLGMAVFPLSLFGLLISVFHLGRPLLSFRALRNLGSSRLSLEIVATLLFVLLALIYSASWWRDRGESRALLGTVTSLFGLVAIVCSSAIYLLPTRPAWDSGWVPVSFLGTALLLGGFAPAALVDLSGQRPLARIFLAIGVAGSLMLLGSAMWMLAHFSRASADQFVSTRLQASLQLLSQPWYSGWFGVHALLIGLIPVGLALRFWSGGHQPASDSGTPLLVFLAAVLGTIIGRALMFEFGAALPPF